jgi:RimJ/RimL family protein N-acetyltransferase
MIPRLETERLILRGFRPQDFESFAGFFLDPDFVRFITVSGQPVARNDVWRTFAYLQGHWALRGYGFWIVERKADGVHLGHVGLNNPEGWPGLEVGWSLGRPYWGHGYATEAARAAMEYAFLTQPVDKVISCIDPDNQPSQNVAARLGETRGERVELAIQSRKFVVDLWSIGRSEWLRRQNG